MLNLLLAKIIWIKNINYNIKIDIIYLTNLYTKSVKYGKKYT